LFVHKYNILLLYNSIMNQGGEQQRTTCSGGAGAAENAQNVFGGMGQQHAAVNQGNAIAMNNPVTTVSGGKIPLSEVVVPAVLVGLANRYATRKGGQQQQRQRQQQQQQRQRQQRQESRRKESRRHGGKSRRNQRQQQNERKNNTRKARKQTRK
jgi:hypothetical protein